MELTKRIVKSIFLFVVLIFSITTLVVMKESKPNEQDVDYTI